MHHIYLKVGNRLLHIGIVACQVDVILIVAATASTFGGSIPASHLVKSSDTC
jgi:hypothetical protein